MICQECGKRPATLHFTKIVNGEKTEYHICEQCAQEKGEIFPGGLSSNFSIQNLLSGLLNFDTSPSSLGINQEKTFRCENCGLTYAQFSKSGRFGCSECYRYFNHKLDPLFRRLHGNTSHSGKVPERSGGEIKIRKELERLKQELQHRISTEEFEKAAEIRDRIRELEKKLEA
ncbi:protein-arginine kinase activator protein McsA [Bacillaceae bacterium]